MHFEFSEIDYKLNCFPELAKLSTYYLNHKINVYYLNCSCKDYRAKVKKYPVRDFRRICKHLYYKLIKDYGTYISDEMKYLLEIQFWVGLDYVYKVNSLRGDIFLAYSCKTSSVYLFSKDKEITKRGIFNMDENKWLISRLDFDNDSLLVDGFLNCVKTIKNNILNKEDKKELTNYQLPIIEGQCVVHYNTDDTKRVTDSSAYQFYKVTP